MILKSHESMSDARYQLKDHSQQQKSHSRIRSKFVIFSSEQMQNLQSIEHSVESQLIEVLNLKMSDIQLVSIENLIQMKLMTMKHRMKNNANEEPQHYTES
jgi:hypothetical protein